MPIPYLDFLFHPRSIALAGVSPDLSAYNRGRLFMQSLMDFGFKGKIYPIHPAGGEVFNRTIYKSVKDIEDAVDYVISAIPAKLTPQLIRECADKHVKVVHLYSSGYSEIEDEIGKHLESEILSIARKGNVRLLGPNCMGIYCPSSGMTYSAKSPVQKSFSKAEGPLAFLSQSGGNTTYMIRHCMERGIFFSKAISYGNAADLNETDFLDYLADDSDTQIVAMYIEGLKDGKKFRHSMSRALLKKPVVVNKSANTEAGARTCSSHTSAIAGSTAIWNGLLNQVGAIQVRDMDGLVDICDTFLKMPVPAGRNTVVVGTGGGVCVKAADDVNNAGLHLPMLTAELRKQLRDIYGTEAGSSFRNPVDTPGVTKAENLINTVEMIADSKHVDIIIMHFPFDIWGSNRDVSLGPFVEAVDELAHSIRKPLAIALHYAVDRDSKLKAEEIRQRFIALGLPVYSSIGRAACAISKYIEYHERRRNRQY